MTKAHVCWCSWENTSQSVIFTMSSPTSNVCASRDNLLIVQCTCIPIFTGRHLFAGKRQDIIRPRLRGGYPDYSGPTEGTQKPVGRWWHSRVLREKKRVSDFRLG